MTHNITLHPGHVTQLARLVPVSQSLTDAATAAAIKA